MALSNYPYALLLGAFLWFTGMETDALKAMELALICLDMIFLIKVGLAASKGSPNGRRAVGKLAAITGLSSLVAASGVITFASAYVLMRIVENAVGFALFVAHKLQSSRKKS